MRWIWIDTFVEFVSGERASAAWNVTLAEDHLHEYGGSPGVFPPTLMIEGMAQTAGLLVGEARGFRENVILAKIRHAEFDGYARAGDRLRYDAVIDSLDERASATRGTVLVGDKQIGHVDLIFSHVGAGETPAGVPNENFVFTESFMSLLQDLRDAKPDGSSTTDGK